MAKSDNKDKFEPKICEIKHTEVDKEIDNIEKEQDELNKNLQNTREENNKDHFEIKGMITALDINIKNTYKNLRDKIILSKKTTEKKIDGLNSFDNTLRGNGDPGVWESIRTMRRNIKIILWIIVVMLILQLGGSWRGVTYEKIREKIGLKNQKVEEEPGKWSFIYPPIKVEDPDDVSVVLKNKEK
jgi:hypothetical protein